ncbi:RES domain-containing protein [Mycobacterium sp. PDNC021]|uniref:RES domain-containing protein n=1 Tax=Mycobacterium sp. PDNC021 TaxID=3391399 RepID=UPI003AAB8140
MCPAHVQEPFLRAYIASHLTEATCSYCDAQSSPRSPAAISMEVFMADAFLPAVYLYYQPQSLPAKHAELLTSVFSAEFVAQEIADIAGIGDELLLEHLSNALSVTPDWIKQDWERGPLDEQMTHSWETFKNLVKHQTRFFFAERSTGPDGCSSMTASQLLRAVAAAIQDIGEVWPTPCPHPLYRARMSRSLAEASTFLDASQIGPPPPTLAAANRMSPAGISMFYGSTDRETAIAEVGAHSSQSWVVTGEFTPAREIRLIDLTQLPAVPSIFDSGRRPQFHAIRFLHRFVEDITLPVELDGREHIDYVPTQVFTEYLRYAFPARVDGLMFPSSQGSGSNVVVFYGPDFCSDDTPANDYTRLLMNSATVTVDRVITVALH